MNKLTDFARGIIAGFVCAAIIFGVITAFYFLKQRDRGIIEYAEKQIEIEEMREDIINRPPDEFLEIPDVRRSVDGAAAEFERKRDEALQRFRSRLASRAGLAD